MYSGFGNTDLNDPFFSDTVDIRLYRAIMAVYDSESESIVATLKGAYDFTLKNRNSKFLDSRLHSLKTKVNKTPKEVSETLILIMLTEYLSGDYLKLSVKDAYFNKKNIPVLPTVTTFLSNSDFSSANVSVNIIENGGSEFLQKGIVCATIYNPVLQNNIINSGTGDGAFTETITELEMGVKYYARAFATNSEGTAFGNCVELKLNQNTSNSELNISEFECNVFPNPVRDYARIVIRPTNNERIFLKIIDVLGKMVVEKEFAGFAHSNSEQDIDLTQLKPGVYQFIFSNENKILGKQKVVKID